MDVFVQFHHVVEVVLEFSEPLPVLQYHLLLRSGHGLQLLQFRGVFLYPARVLLGGDFGLWLGGLLSDAVLLS